MYILAGHLASQPLTDTDSRMGSRVHSISFRRALIRTGLRLKRYAWAGQDLWESDEWTNGVERELQSKVDCADCRPDSTLDLAVLGGQDGQDMSGQGPCCKDRQAPVMFFFIIGGLSD